LSSVAGAVGLLVCESVGEWVEGGDWMKSDQAVAVAPPGISTSDKSPLGGKKPLHIPRWVRVTASILILGLTIWFVVIPQFRDAKGALTSLAGVAWPLVIAALGLELASLASYSELTKIVLDRNHPGYFTLLRIDLTDVGVNHVVPGGGVTSGALRLRLFSRVGIPAAAGFTTATIQILGSNLVLGGLFGIGVALSVASFSENLLYAVAAGAVLALLVGAGVAAWVLVRHTDFAVRVVRAAVRHLPFITEVGAEAFIRAMALQTRTIGEDRRRVVHAVIFAVANWLFDAGSLWVLFAAFGHILGIGAILTVYGLGTILAQLPLTPGGIGIVEGVMVPAFVAFGAPASIAVLGVIGWRLLEYWMPLPLSLVAYTSLRLGPLRPLKRNRVKR